MFSKIGEYHDDIIVMKRLIKLIHFYCIIINIW